jgi:phospholipase A-2-activating protein
MPQIYALTRTSINISLPNYLIALTTLYINYSVLLTSTHDSSSPSSDRSIDLVVDLLEPLTHIVSTAQVSEAVYRALIAVGTLIGLGEEVRMVATEGFELSDAMKKAEERVGEPRIKNVVAEIREALEGSHRPHHVLKD